MKYICDLCQKEGSKDFDPCVVTIPDHQEPPYSCLYANSEKEMESDWRPLSDSDYFELRGIGNCAKSCDNCATQNAKDPKARYYDAGGVEVLDVIKAKLTPEQFKGWLLGNLIKYSARANFKGQFARDIEKVKFYSSELFGILEA